MANEVDLSHQSEQPAHQEILNLPREFTYLLGNILKTLYFDNKSTIGIQSSSKIHTTNFYKATTGMPVEKVALPRLMQ